MRRILWWQHHRICNRRGLSLGRYLHGLRLPNPNAVAIQDRGKQGGQLQDDFRANPLHAPQFLVMLVTLLDIFGPSRLEDQEAGIPVADRQIQVGDRIRVNPLEGEYLERVK